MRLNQGLLLLVLFYHLSLGYYTSYGVYKSYNEYFCRHRRPDKPDFNQVSKGFVLHPKSLNFEYSPKMVSLYSINDQLVLIDKNLNKFSWIGDEYKESYKINERYFEVKCTKGVKLKRDECDIIYATDKDLPKLNITIANEIIIGDEGYLHDNVISDLIMTAPNGSYSVQNLFCVLKKSQETCSLRQEVSDGFYLGYVVLTCSLLFIYLLSIFNIKSYFLIRFMNKCLNYFRSLEIGSCANFCNPITGAPEFLRDFQTINKLDKVNSFRRPQEENEHRLFYFKDLWGEYHILGNMVIAKRGSEIECIEASKSDLMMISSYFFEINLDHQMCVLNDKEDHFLTTLEVIKSVCNGESIVKSLKNGDGFCLQIKFAEFKNLTACFPNLSESIKKKLLEHNWRFFGDGYNIKALELCLDGKMSYYHRLKDIKNSAWKLYTSDFTHIMGNTGINYKCQNNWKPSKTLRGLDGINWEEKEILPMVSEIKLNVSVDNTNSEDRTISHKITINKAINAAVEAIRIGSSLNDMGLKKRENKYDNKNSEWTSRLNQYSDNLTNTNSFISALSEERKGDPAKITEIPKECSLRIAKEIREKIFKLKSIVDEGQDFIEDTPYEMSESDLNRLNSIKEKSGNGARYKNFVKKFKRGNVYKNILNNYQAVTGELIKSTCGFIYFNGLYEKLEEYDKEIESKTSGLGDGACKDDSEVITIPTSDLFNNFTYKKNNNKGGKEKRKKEKKKKKKKKWMEKTDIPKKAERGDVVLRGRIYCRDIEKHLEASIQENFEGGNNLRPKTYITMRNYIKNKTSKRVSILNSEKSKGDKDMNKVILGEFQHPSNFINKKHIEIHNFLIDRSIDYSGVSNHKKSYEIFNKSFELIEEFLNQDQLPI